MSIFDTPLIGFDTETTGISVRNDRIVTACIVVQTPDGVASQYNWLIDPGVEIPAQATNVHGISTEYAREHGAEPTTALDEIADSISKALEAGGTLVAFNASYDLTLLEQELRRHGLPSLQERLGTEIAPVADPLILDRHFDRYRRGKRTLGDLVTHYGIAIDQSQLHSADADVAATLGVLAAIARAHPELTTIHKDQLHQLQKESHRAWAENFSAYLKQKNGTSRGGPSGKWPLEF